MFCATRFSVAPSKAADDVQTISPAMIEYRLRTR
jgi:hypothetical protein